MTVLVVIGLLWLVLGVWLTADGLKKALPAIRAKNDPLVVRALGLTVVVISGVVWLPVRFAVGLVRVGRD